MPVWGMYFSGSVAAPRLPLNSPQDCSAPNLGHASGDELPFGQMMAGGFAAHGFLDTHPECMRVVQQGAQIGFCFGVQTGAQFAVCGDADAVAGCAEATAHWGNQSDTSGCVRQTVIGCRSMRFGDIGQ